MVFDSFDIKSLIRPVIDFPKPGVIFRDITPLFQSPTALRLVMDASLTVTSRPTSPTSARWMPAAS